jgi:hypothetical protein
MDEGRKRVIGIMAAILASLHMQTADDLFGTPQGSPRTDKLIDASIQWAEQIIMQKIDIVCGNSLVPLRLFQSFTSHARASSRLLNAGNSRREKLLRLLEYSSGKFSAPTHADFLT